MKERPILFSAAMVRAILEGRKTQTRRVLSAANSTVDGSNWNSERFATLNLSDPALAEDSSYQKSSGCLKYAASTLDDDPTIGHRIRSRWNVGDLLWVREAWAYRLDHDHLSPTGLIAAGVERAWFWADGPGRCCNTGCAGAAGRVRASMHLPRAYSRITLEITDVRVQRLQNISAHDAESEGIAEQGGNSSDGEWRRVQAFQHLWDSINGKTHPWASNPWLWCLTFKRVAA